MYVYRLKIFGIKVVFYLYVYCSVVMVSTALQSAVKPSSAAQPLIQADSLHKHVAFLTDDALQGRSVGSAGGRRAAAYIAQQLANWGLQPVPPLTDFLQPIPFHGSRALAASSLQLHIEHQVFDFQLGRDYLLFKYGAQTYLPVPVSLVFAGYGITAPEYDYNDYQNLDVDGKIVVFLSGEPFSGDPGYFAGALPTIHSQVETKERVAMAHGAAGSILIPIPGPSTTEDWQLLQREFSFEDVTLSFGAAGHLALIMRPEAGAALFHGAAISWPDVLQMVDRHAVRAAPLAARLSFHGKFKERDFIDYNVVAMIEGQDAKEKNNYVLVSAHYDHLGIGPAVQGDSIYNGAVDNALGVAGLLEMARCFGIISLRPKRSILFLFTTAEEKGLLGATYFVDRPLAPCHRIIAAINLEGLAFIDNFRDIIVIGGELSQLGAWIKPLARENGLIISPMPDGFSRQDAWLHADQLAFARAGIPFLLIVDGLQGQSLTPEQMLRQRLAWYHNRYHSPQDDGEQTLNYAAAQQHANFLFTVVSQLANSSFKPDWLDWSPFRTERLRSLAEKK